MSHQRPSQPGQQPDVDRADDRLDPAEHMTRQLVEDVAAYEVDPPPPVRATPQQSSPAPERPAD